MSRGEKAEVGQPVQIEFFGLPGSGKTTLAGEVNAILRLRDATSIYSPDVTRDHAPGLPRTLARSRLIASWFPWQAANWRLVAEVAAVRQASLRDRVRSLYTCMTVAALYDRLDRTPWNAVIDQGMLQALWSVHLHDRTGFSPAGWSRVLDREAARSRVYVCVETPVEVCSMRLDARSSKHSRMQSDAALNDRALWERADRVRRDLIDGLQAAFQRCAVPPRIVIVDGTGEPAATAADLLRRIG